MRLKPCAFCGGKGELWNNKLTYRLYCVICEECDCMTPYFTTREEAIEAWNRREPIDEIVEQLDRAKDEFSGGTLQEHYYWKGIEDAIEIVKSGGKV